MPQAESMGGAEEMKALHKKLLDGYNPVVRPSRNYSNPTVVSMQLHIFNILGLDQVKQLINMRASLYIKWKDELLQWDPKTYGGIKYILMTQDSVWKPDIILQNSATEHDSVGSGDMLINVKSDGRVTWEPPFYLEGSCKLDMSKYPKDVNNCPVAVHVWMSDNNSVTFTYPKEPIVLTKMMINGEYDISSAGAFKRLDVYSERCYDTLTFVIKLVRRPLYITLSLMIPVTLLAFLSVVPFIMPPEESAKVDLSMTVLLSFTVFLEVIDDQIPPASDNISIMVVYISALMMLSFLSVVGNVLVVTLRHWDEAAGKEAAQSVYLGDNVGKDANEENITNIYSTRAHHDLLETSSSTSHLTEPLITKKQKCHRFFHGTRATKLNKALFILASVLLFVISVAFQIQYRS